MSTTLLATLIGLNLLAAAPKTTHVYPTALTRGTFPVLLVAEGDAGTDSKVWADDPALKIEVGPKPGQYLASAEPACRLGWHVLRIHNKEGVSAPIPLWVDDLANLAEAEPNDHPDQVPMVLVARGSVRMHGRLGRNGDVDGFRVRVPQGVTLTARVTANRALASPMDTTLQIVDPKGFVLAHNDDARGTDPEIVWTAAESGEVIVRVFAFPSEPNSTIGFAGGSAYIYALLLSTGPTIDRSAPIAIDAKSTDVPVFGWNLPAAARAPVIVAASDAEFGLAKVEGGEPHPVVRSAMPVQFVDATSEFVVTPPILAYAAFQEDHAIHRYRFAAKKGESWNFRIFASRWESPADPVLILKKTDGTILAEQDDFGNNIRDVDFSWAVPDDGEYLAEVTDLHRRGGNRFAYGLEVTRDGLPPEVLTDVRNLEIKPGENKEIVLTWDKRATIEEPLKLTFEGLPKGFPEPKLAEAGTPAPSEPARKGSGRRRGGNVANRDSAKFVATVTAEQAKTVGAWSGPIRITATDTAGRKIPVRFGSPGGPWAQVKPDHFWLTVILPDPPKEPAKDEPKKDEPKK